MILRAFGRVPTWSVDWGLCAVRGNKMPPRDPNDDDDEEEEDEEDEDEEDEDEEDEDEEDEDLEPPVVREPWASAHTISLV